MKQVLLLIALMLAVAACAPQAQATELPSVIEEQSTKISTDLTPAQRNAISALAQNLGVAPDQIKLVATEAVDWPDGCLGISMEGVSCAQAITPGFRVTLDVDGKQVEYHTNQDATIVRPATVALTWSRVGGVAGFCDSLTIYLSGEVQGSTCNGSQVLEKRLSDLVSPDQIAILNEWVSTYGTVNLDASDPQGVADGMSVKLQLMGQGTDPLTSPEVQQLLMQFASDLNQKLMTP